MLLIIEINLSEIYFNLCLEYDLEIVYNKELRNVEKVSKG